MAKTMNGTGRKGPDTRKCSNDGDRPFPTPNAPAEREESGAGQDPQKRRQILAGARKVFLKHGFDAASMNDIARVAGVSKGTLYVYFENKERLFTALMHEERSQQDFSTDPHDHDVAAVLTGSAATSSRFLSAPHVIRAKRSVMAIIERMPEVAADFYRDGPAVCVADLTRYLEAQVHAGVLEIDDCDLAANQFLDLAQTGIVKPLLYGTLSRSSETIDAPSKSAVECSSPPTSEVAKRAVPAPRRYRSRSAEAPPALSVRSCGCRKPSAAAPGAGGGGSGCRPSRSSSRSARRGGGSPSSA